jgi:hypothetical protein
VIAPLLLALALAADLTPRPAARTATGETRCGACHTTAGWKDVTFAHDRTGFPLTGRHQQVTCSACHEGGHFDQPVARACSACHRDVHAQRLGQRCDRCHDTGSWKETSFGPDSHRRTNFPLTGRHAFIPCDECHGNKRDRAFARPTSQCVDCHQANYQSTAGSALDHVAAGFPTDCRSCHGSWRFKPATWPAHDQCFAIRSGPHAGISCEQCHAYGIPPFPPAGTALTCTATPAAHCTGCHSTSEHPAVPGFQPPTDGRCYGCHQFTPSGRKAAPLKGGFR